MDTSPLFIADLRDVRAKLRTLSKVKDDEWEPQYADLRTGERWVGYRIDDNPGYLEPTMLRRPDLRPEDVVRQIVTTNRDDEAAAAGHYLRWVVGPEAAFPALVEALEAAVREAPSSRALRNILIALLWSRVAEAFNFRSTEGKSAREVQRDFLFFMALAERANRVKSETEKRLGYEITFAEPVFGNR